MLFCWNTTLLGLAAVIDLTVARQGIPFCLSLVMIFYLAFPRVTKKFTNTRLLLLLGFALFQDVILGRQIPANLIAAVISLALLPLWRSYGNPQASFLQCIPGLLLGLIQALSLMLCFRGFSARLFLYLLVEGTVLLPVIQNLLDALAIGVGRDIPQYKTTPAIDESHDQEEP